MAEAPKPKVAGSLRPPAQPPRVALDLADEPPEKPEGFLHAILSWHWKRKHPRSDGGAIAANDDFLHSLLTRFFVPTQRELKGFLLSLRERFCGFVRKCQSFFCR